jgi:uncharacterized protein YjbJ (UPF0337 family)
MAASVHSTNDNNTEGRKIYSSLGHAFERCGTPIPGHMLRPSLHRAIRVRKVSERHVPNSRRHNGEFVTHPGSLGPGRKHETSGSLKRSPHTKLQERKMVDKDRVKGSAEQAKGKAKEWAGKVTGDAKMESEGKSDQVKGKIQNTVGGLKDAVREK